MDFYGYYVIESEGRGLAVGHGWSREVTYDKSVRNAKAFNSAKLAEDWALIFDVPDYKIREVNVT